MKVYGINNNTTNFSALRIPKKNAERNLVVLGKKTFERLDTAGEIVKDTQFYHIYLDGECYIRHINGKRFDSPYTVHNAGTNLMIGYKEGLNQVKIKLPFGNAKAVSDAITDITTSETQIERTAKIVKYLDDYEKKKSAQNVVEEIKPTDKFETKISKLIDKYGV